MAAPKDPDENSEPKWDFRIEDIKSEKAERSALSNNGSKKNKIQLKNSHKLAKTENKLELDHSSVSKAKSRSAMAFELNQNVNDVAEDSFTLASLPKRAFAFLLDLILMAALIYFVKFSLSIIREFTRALMNENKYKLMIPESQIMNLLMCSALLILLFSFVVIPAAFFNTSFGKKLMGLRVRGIEKYTLSISTAFKRELIMKPISIILVVGFITPFISKKRFSIHDMLAETIVIEDD